MRKTIPGLMATGLMSLGLCALASTPTQAQSFDDAYALLETDPVAAVSMLEDLSAQGGREAKNLLAIVLNDPPDGITGDRPRAMRLWEEAAAAGDDGLARTSPRG